MIFWQKFILGGLQKKHNFVYSTKQRQLTLYTGKYCRLRILCVLATIATTFDVVRGKLSLFHITDMLEHYYFVC